MKLNWKKNLASKEANFYPYLFKEQLEKNALLVTTLQIAHDAIEAIANEADPEKIKALAVSSIASMRKTLAK